MPRGDPGHGAHGGRVSPPTGPGAADARSLLLFNSLNLPLLWSGSVYVMTTCPSSSSGRSTCSRYVSKTSAVVVPSTTRDGPIPSKLMLASNVVFLPSFPCYGYFQMLPLAE
jgi:hypothetical protein